MKNIDPMPLDEQNASERGQLSLGLDTEEDEEGGGASSEPFDPTKIRIDSRIVSVDYLIRQIEEGSLHLSPDFQQTRRPWAPGAQSRFIESLMIRLPIPPLYIDATEEGDWLVVDGLRRLSVLRRFILEKDLRLVDLEFLTLHNGKTFDELPRAMQRRIEETSIPVFLIEPGTPPEVKFTIFTRLNTGGLPLSPQEIRHVLNQGPAAELLAQLAEEEAFQRVAGQYIRDQRMSDRECVLRFLAFATTSYESYHSGNLGAFLDTQMRNLGRRTKAELDELTRRFVRAMRAAYDLFGDEAFRKRDKHGEASKALNKALFEAWSVNLDALSDEETGRLIERKAALLEGFIELSRQSDFDKSLSQGTGSVAKVKLRFEEIGKLIRRVLA